MINDIILEGIVVRDPWKYMDDLFFRMVTYRDSDLPAKKLDLERDAGDYVNVRVNGGANGLIQIRRGMRLRVHGFLQSRDYRESLEDFISKARKSKTCATLAIDIRGCDRKQDQVLIDRNVVEVVARRIVVAAAQSERRGRATDRTSSIEDTETEKAPGDTEVASSNPAMIED